MTSKSVPLKKALTIASSDSGGGAGVQADLKTFSALCVFGMSVISAVTAQNSVAVIGMECLSPDLVTKQLEAVFDDIGVDAIKIGLLGNKANTEAVTAFLASKKGSLPVVLDPVMVSASGHAFLPKDAVDALLDLIALATLVTPNLPEAEVLSGIKIKDPSDHQKAAEKLLRLGAENVLIKAGHSAGPQCDDFLLGSEGSLWLRGDRIDTFNNHGTGCTLSSAIASFLARDFPLSQACRAAKDYVTEGLTHSIKIGAGPGPLNHFHNFYRF
ncbi:MAG: bifunctional hydroxymethylpyrimidine kinase/phosphomethylpyrimidine kinase [Deltaproteobacteria bacterium]|jgi:hydroxymethylpyrimidine/phosphomethylpyrimidine kinase|nr:bifunctional hydroxymethylpyrimidine kinase/phosphomethylpyrimidine kinase [Deltaproteobacteria bacterium]